MKRFLASLALALAFISPAMGQEKETRGKASVGFTNISLDYGRANVKGLNASAQVKVAGDKKFKLEGVVDTTFMFADGELLQTYLGGPQVGVNIGGRFNPFARLLYGASLYEGTRSYTHSAGVGVDFRIAKRTFFRGTYDRIDIKRLAPFYRTVVGIGIEF